MLGWVLFLAGVASGVVVSLLAKRHRLVEESAGLFSGLMLLLLVTMAWMVRLLWDVLAGFGPIVALFSLALLVGIVGLAWNAYIVGFLSHAVTVSLPRWWMGDHRLAAPVSFDRGDAAMKAGDPRRALALYEAGQAGRPDDPDLFLRMAEAHRALGDARRRAACLREAARCTGDPHRRGPILLQLSEALEGAEAARALEGVLGDPALSAYHAPARSRLAALRP